MRVVKYLVDYVTQFPSDTECTRYIATISDKVCVIFSVSELKLLCIFVNGIVLSCVAF